MAADIDPLAGHGRHLKVQVLIVVFAFACGAELAADAPIVSAQGAVQIALAPAPHQKLGGSGFGLDR